MQRATRGQMALSLNLVIAIFVVGSLGLVSYEISRILLAREQLKHCLELAALSGGATMASTSQSGSTARDLATTVAMNILRKNSILGQSLSNTVQQVSSMSMLTPAAGQTSVYFEFDDPVTRQPSPTGDVMRVNGAYSYQLFSGGFGSIGVAVYTLIADAEAGLPAMDVVFVYENSSSMDDQTNVTTVTRYWDPTIPEIAYRIPTTGGPQEGPIWGITCPNSIGTAVNGLPPQNLDAAGDPKVSNCMKEFSETGPTGSTVPLRGVTNTGTPPGDAPFSAGGANGAGGPGMGSGPGSTSTEFAYNPNYGRAGKKPSWLKEWAPRIAQFHLELPADAWFTPGFDPGTPQYNPWGASPTLFTDIVVNLDGNTHFGGYTEPAPGPFSSFPFDDLGYLTEASRGNMDSNGIAPSVHTDNQIAGACKPGYAQAYQCLAYRQLQPKRTIEAAMQTFMGKLAATSDCHFGFVAYNNRAGISPTDTDRDWNVSWAYPVAGKVKYLLPQIPLDLASNNVNAISTLLANPTVSSDTQPLFVPNGGANLADGLVKALATLSSAGSRPGALKAIVVVTDKVPTRDLAGNIYSDPSSNTQAINDAIGQATAAHNLGIPIFVVALDQTGGQMGPYISSQYSDVNNGGLVKTAGNGGALYMENWVNPVATYSSMVGDFNNVVRQLMTLVQG